MVVQSQSTKSIEFEDFMVMPWDEKEKVIEKVDMNKLKDLYEKVK